MSFHECHRHAKVVEGVSHAVSEATYDEERHAEQERKIFLLTCKCHRCRHQEAAADAEKAAEERSGAEAELQDILRSALYVPR